MSEELDEIKAATQPKTNDKPIRDGLKFLLDNGNFTEKDKKIGKALQSKGTLSNKELKLAQGILKKYEEYLTPELLLEIAKYEPEKPTKSKSSSKAIEGLTGQFFSTPQGLKFYVEAEGMPIEIESESFEGLISDRKYKAGDGLPSGDEIASIRRLARYWASNNLREIGVRNARFKDGIIYDPVRPDGKVYFITKKGYELKTPDQPYTVRYTGMLEAAVEEGKLQDHLDLIRLWQLDENSELLSMGLDFSRFIPDIPHAIEDIDGPHGSGKTSHTETKRFIFDPNGAPTQSLKFDERDLSISAVHQGMLAFDNVNAALPDSISDIICRLTTGQGYRTRELYTNTGEVILKLKRPIIINGINRASYKPDFIDRECPIHLGVMPESRRLTDTVIRAKAEILIPKVRGFIISIIPKAMELYPQVESELKGKLPRMADFVIWGECGIRAMGFPAMSFYKAYMDAKHEETLDVARDTLIISAIQSLMANREEWVGTTKDLLDNLEDVVTENQRKSKAFPKDERRLGRLLRELIPTLREIGLTIVDLKNNKHEKKILKIPETGKVNSTNSTNQNGLANNGFSENENNKNTDLGNLLIASKADPENYDVQNESAISAINYHEPGNNENIKTDGKLKSNPSKSDVQNDSKGVHYILLSILDNVNVAAEDGRDYNLRKGDIVHIPEINANLLIKRGWAREIQSRQSKKETTQVPPFQNDGTLGTLGTEFKPEPTKHDVQNEKSNHDEKPENAESITLTEAEEIKNTILNRGIHLIESETGQSSDGKKYRLGVPTKYYKQNREFVDQAMREIGFTKGNTGEFTTVFFNRKLKESDPK